MEKVKLPKEVSKVIMSEFGGLTPNGIGWALFNIVKLDKNNLTEDAGVIKDYFVADRLYELMQAIVNGYEVEETPEDKLREQYNNPRHFVNLEEDIDRTIYQKGIRFALDTLNIKIEGVNS